MRYYDTQLTPTTSKIYLESSLDRIPETDERVSTWFTSLPDGYRRAYDVDGLPFNEMIPLPTQEEITAQADAQLVSEAKAYLLSTDYKMLSDYDGDTTGIVAARAEARNTIRTKEVI